MENKNIKKFYQQAPKPFNYVPNDLVSGSPVLPPTMSGLMRIDPDSGDIWISAGNTLVSDWKLITGGGGGGGGTYTVTNGLTESPANNFKLGGALTEETTLTTNSVGSLAVVSTEGFAGTAPLTVANFSTNGNIATFFRLINGINNDGVLISEIDTNPFFPSNYSPLRIVSSAALNSDWTMLSFKKGPNGLNSACSINYEFETSQGVTPAPVRGLAAKTRVIVNNETAANYSVGYEIHTSFGSTTVPPGNIIPVIERKMLVAGNGRLTLDKYGSATFNGAVRYLLAVDTAGNVQEVTLAGLTNALNDAAAAAAGVPLSGIYRNGSVLQIRAI